MDQNITVTAGASASAVGERVLTVVELARQFHVSTKTISRWRRRGLVSRRFVFDGRKRLSFLQSSVDRFLALNQERVRRAGRFSRLTDEDRQQIVERARRWAEAGECPAKVTRRTAQETGRSAETVRSTLKHFNREHPDMAIFPGGRGPLGSEVKREIYQQYRRGESVRALAERFCRAPSRIYRIINEMRAARIARLPLDYIGNDEFASLRSQRKEAEVLGPPPQTDPPPKSLRVPADVPPYLASLYEVPLLTQQEEAHLFRKMNYLKYKASALRAQLDVDRPKSKLMDRIEKLYDESIATKNQIIRANLRLVVSIAKRYVAQPGDFFELVSDGNMSLIRAVEKFDVSRGNKFSTYASWAIMKNFSRTVPAAVRHRDRFRTNAPEMLGSAEGVCADHSEQELAHTQRVSQVQGILKRLDERERQIVTRRFGLVLGQESLTLKQVGAVMGVTKERIRQIQSRALNKLRKAAEEDRVNAPD